MDRTHRRAIARLGMAAALVASSFTSAFADTTYPVPAPWSADCSALDATHGRVVARVLASGGEGLLFGAAGSSGVVVLVDGRVQRVSINLSGSHAVVESITGSGAQVVTLFTADGTKKWTRPDRRRYDFDAVGLALVAWSPDPSLESSPDEIAFEIFGLDGVSQWNMRLRGFDERRPGVVALSGGDVVVVGHSKGLQAVTRSGPSWRYERGFHESLIHDIRPLRHDRVAVRHDFGTPKVVDTEGRLIAAGSEGAVASTGLVLDWDLYQHVEPWGVAEKTRVLFHSSRKAEAFVYDATTGKYGLHAIDAEPPSGFQRCGKARLGGLVFVRPSEIRVRDLQP